MTTYWLIQTDQLHILSKFSYYYIAFFLSTSLFCVFCILRWNSSNDYCQNLFSFEKIKELEEKEDRRDMERERQAWLQMAEKEVGDDDKSMHFMILPKSLLMSFMYLQTNWRTDRVTVTKNRWCVCNLNQDAQITSSDVYQLSFV